MLKYSLIIGLIFCFNLITHSQPANDGCTNAIRLCAGQTIQGTTTAATTNVAEDNNFCAITSATIWFIFTTNSTGGDVSIDFSNLNFNPGATYGQSIDAIIYSASTPCDQTTYTPSSNCFNGSSNFSCFNPIASPLAANTTYYVMVNATNTGGGVTNSAECDFDVTITGTAVSASFPIVTIASNDTILCQGDGDTVTTSISNCSGTTSYDWYYDNTQINTGSTNDFNTNTLTTSGWLKLILSCGDLCIYSDTTDSVYFNVTPILANAGPDKFIQKGDVVVLEGTGSGTPVWSPSNTLTDPNIFQPSAYPEFTTIYYLEVTNGNCTATDNVNVFIGEVIVIFTAFSPNNDDINDKWIIKNSDQYPDMEVTIYDRSGQRIYNTTGYSTQDKWWDGTYKNKPLPVSTYYYVIDLKIGDDGIFKGQVNIIK